MQYHVSAHLGRHLQISVFLLVFLYCIVLYLSPDSFKFGVGITLLFIGVVYILTKNLFASLFIAFLVSSQFFFPAKTYQFEYASPTEYVYELLPNGIFESIAITLADICSGFMIVYFIINKIFNPSGLTAKKGVSATLGIPLVTIILLAWLFYFSISLYSSLYLSFSPAFSVNLLAQYGNMVIMFLGILFFFHHTKHLIRVFYVVLIAILLFQSILGTFQFAKSLTSYGSSEKLPSVDLEQSVDFSRVEGISGHPNGHALIIANLLILTFPFVLKNKKNKWWIISILGFLNIVFSQSRVVWAALIMLLPLIYMLYASGLRPTIIRLIKAKHFYLAILGVLALSTIILPRLQASALFFSEEGGGTLRLKMISEGWQLLQSSLWTGFGAGTGVRVLLDNFSNGYIATFPFPIHVAYLQIALESGVPATIAFFIPIYLVVREWVQINKNIKRRNHMLLSTVCCIIVVLVYYALQPVYGRREFVILGIILGSGIVSLTERSNSKYYEF